MFPAMGLYSLSECCLGFYNFLVASPLHCFLFFVFVFYMYFYYHSHRLTCAVYISHLGNVLGLKMLECPELSKKGGVKCFS